MSECGHFSRCTFFEDRMSKMPGMAEMLKGRYCQGEFGECARHRVTEEFGIDAVPSDLFPNQLDVAEQILYQLRTA